MLEAVRASRYGDVVAAARVLAPELDSLEQEQLNDLMDAVWSAATGLYDNSQEEMDGYDLVVAIGDVLLKGGRSDPALRERMTEALFNKGLTLGALNRSEEAVSVYDEVVKRFGDATEPAAREQVAKALFNKGVRLGALNRSEEAVSVYDEVVKRFGDATEPALREQVAWALVNKGMSLGALNRSEESIAVYDEVVKRFGDATGPALREPVAKALVNKGFRLGALNQSEEAVSVYDEVVKRFADATEPAVRESVGAALNGTGFTFLCDAKRMWPMGEPAARDLLLRAEENLRAALDRVPDGPVILGNLGYVVFLSGRVDEARELLVRAIRLGGERLRQVELDDAAIHPLPQDETLKLLRNSFVRFRDL
ncbi:MAG: tetratricopeptide repeat protein, partial [bacterium]